MFVKITMSAEFDLVTDVKIVSPKDYTGATTDPGADYNDSTEVRTLKSDGSLLHGIGFDSLNKKTIYFQIDFDSPAVQV